MKSTHTLRSALLALLLLTPLSLLGVAHAQDADPDQPADQPAEEAGDAKPDGVRGEVKRVTAYRGQAMITREVPVQAGSGLMEVTVRDLPARIQRDSLFADGGRGLEVRAVRFRERRISVGGNKSGAAELWEQIDAVDALIRKNTSDRALHKSQTTFLSSVEQFAQNIKLAENSQGVLNAEELASLTEFIFELRSDLNERDFQLSEDSRELQERRTELMQRLQRLGSYSLRTVYEAVIFIDKRDEAATTVNLSYLVGGVDWRPTYTLRAARGGENVELEYSAMITQTSGEDWENVELTLSTASPALIAQGVELDPLEVALASNQGRPSASTEVPNEKVVEEYRRLRSQQLESARGGARPNSPQQEATQSAEEMYEAESKSNARLKSRLNSLADQLQRLELEQADQRGLLTAGSNEGISVEYRLPGTQGIASRFDQQFISIAEHEIEAETAFVATPTLSEYVYLHAELQNDTDTVLLEGPYTAYLDGRVVGRSSIPMVARGESFTVGFGIDEQLRVSRTLVEKSSTTQGGNQVTRFEYTIGLENFKQDAVEIRVYDRIPVAQGSALRVNFEAEASTPLSTDRLYVKEKKPEGILRWDFEVPASAAGADAAEISYAYSLEYDRQMRIVIPNE